MSTPSPDDSETLIRASALSGADIPDEVRTKIGDLVSRWSYVEFQLKVAIRVSLDITRATQNVLLHGRDLRSLCEIARNIADAGNVWVPDVALREKMKRLAAAISHGTYTRNQYAHGVFGIPKKGKHKGKFSRYLSQDLGHKIEPDWHPTLAHDIDPLIRKATQLGVRAQNLTVHLKTLKEKKAPKRWIPNENRG